MIKIKIFSALSSLLIGNLLLYLYLLIWDFLNPIETSSLNIGTGFVITVILYVSFLFIFIYGIPISFVIGKITEKISSRKIVASLVLHSLLGFLGPLLFGFIQDPFDFLFEEDGLLMCIIGAYFAVIFDFAQLILIKKN
ncbi:hypothetical protein [Bacillus sp. X1(2014)]|uniref:hypothetical protein n=1 Tax=Bacillus sp. X1(2014) TaxID=1565991 RepID=UPI0011A1BCA0|nr:hypothetical protein [Bacillus sp. X1(2014)]